MNWNNKFEIILLLLLIAFFLRKNGEFIFQVAEMPAKCWGLYWNMALHSSVWAL